MKQTLEIENGMWEMSADAWRREWKYEKEQQAFILSSYAMGFGGLCLGEEFINLVV